jgi:presenilin-like A22 family membrane protease
MNSRKIIFAGIMTALAGAMIGLAVARIRDRADRPVVVTGAVLGFIIGAGKESIGQQSRIRNTENLTASLEQKKEN